MSEKGWVILISAVVMFFWCIGVGRILWKRHKVKKEASGDDEKDKDR